MTRDQIITDLHDKLAIAVTGYDAKPTAETANEIKFLYRRLKFYEGDWPEIYEQWNVSKPPDCELRSGRPVEFGSAEWFASVPEVEVP